MPIAGSVQQVGRVFQEVGATAPAIGGDSRTIVLNFGTIGGGIREVGGNLAATGWSFQEVVRTAGKTSAAVARVVWEAAGNFWKTCSVEAVLR